MLQSSTLFILIFLTNFLIANDRPAALLEGTGQSRLLYKAVPVFNQHPWKQTIAMTPVKGQPGSYIIIERYGNLWYLSPKGKRHLFFKKTGNLINGIFDKDFPKQPYFYFRFSSQGQNRLRRYEVNLKEMTIIPESEKVILEWKTIGHRGGGMAFGPDGFLYISTGDARKPGDPDNSGQKTDNLRGSILRIDVSDKSKTYKIPQDNPFIESPNTRPEVWSYGLRNPWRFTFKPGTNEIWIGDNGDESWEMVSKATKGSNHGWSVYEGNHFFRPGQKLSGPNPVHSPAIVEHPHQEMRSIIGGPWYKGSKFKELSGHYIYGGFVTGRLWSFSFKDGSPKNVRKIADIGGQIVSFAEDPEGEIFIITLDKGIFKLEKATPKKLKPVPSLLSQTGLFKSTQKHSTAPGLIEYEINLPMFKDGASSRRYIGLPKNSRIRFRPTHRKISLLPDLRSRSTLDKFELPQGSVLVKTYFLGETKVETQISLNDKGEWRFLNYRWHEDQKDAQLVKEEGENTLLKLKGRKEIQWRFMGKNECSSCHTHLSSFAPGLTLSQIKNLDVFKGADLFPKSFQPPPETPALSQPDDETKSLEDRARDYLHVNCAHCHRQAGLGGRANFQLLAWLKTEDLKLINEKPLVGIPGVSPEKVKLISPGKPEHSDIYRRISSPAGRMPLIGTSTIDYQGAELIKKWIKSLK